MFRYDQFQDACSWERTNSIWLLSVFVFPTVNVFLEGDRAGSLFLDEAGQEMEERLRAQRCLTTPHWMWFQEPHTKISTIDPEFLATALRAVTVSGPSTVYHLVFTPILSFLTVTRLESFSPHGGGRFSIDSSQTIPVLQAIDAACNVRCQVCVCHTRRMFPRSLANEIHFPLWCGWEPVAKSTRQGWYKHRIAVRDTLVYILMSAYCSHICSFLK